MRNCVSRAKAKKTEEFIQKTFSLESQILVNLNCYIIKVKCCKEGPVNWSIVSSQQYLSNLR